MTNRIVAAVDGSAASRAALQWAYTEASRAGGDLLALHVVDMTGHVPSAAGPDVAVERAVAANQRRVMAALPGLSDVDCPVRVTVSSASGPLVPSVARSARDATLLVVGEPESGEHADLPERLADECRCDVVAVSADSVARQVIASRESTGAGSSWRERTVQRS